MFLFGGGGVSIAIAVDHPDATYLAGETVKARITLTTKKTTKVRQVRAGLVCLERYKATEISRDSDGDDTSSDVWRGDERWVHKEVLFTEGSVPGDFSKTYDFAWTIPADAPASGAGKISEIRWIIKVTVDRSMAKDTNEEHEIAVRAVPTGAPRHSNGADSSSSHTVRMQLALGTLELAAGRELTGRLTVEPFQSIKGRALRLDLVRTEYVSTGDRINREETRCMTVDLVPDPCFEPGLPLSYDFVLAVPGDAVPSRKTPHSELGWLVRAVIDVPMAADHVADQEVTVYNAAPIAVG